MRADFSVLAKDLAKRSPVDPIQIAMGVCLGKVVTVALLRDLDESLMFFGGNNVIDAKQVVLDPVSIPKPERHLLMIAAGYEPIRDSHDLLEFRLTRFHNSPLSIADHNCAKPPV